MKKISLLITCFCFLLFPGHSQKKLSIDVAAIRNTQKPINGLNLSCFYYFNNRFTAGLEVNRFFPVRVKSEHGDMALSALDVELNMHYLIEVHHKVQLYPIAGVGHTTDGEKNRSAGQEHHEYFWSVNTGGGLLWEVGHWGPHIEYNFAWGEQNHQFLLAGISYEIPVHQLRKNHKTQKVID